MPIDKNPCRKCEKRNAECHAACMKYRDWSSANERARAERERQLTRELRAYRNASITKQIRRKWQGAK